MKWLLFAGTFTYTHLIPMPNLGNTLWWTLPACLLVSFQSVQRQYEKWRNDCGDCQCKQSSGGWLTHDLQSPLVPGEKGAGSVWFTQMWEQGPTDPRTKMTNQGKRGSLFGQWRSSSGWVGGEVNIGFSGWVCRGSSADASPAHSLGRAVRVG